MRSSIYHHLAFFALGFLFTDSSAFGGLFVTMTGTIAEGSLNGNSLDGQGFSLQGELLNGTDLEPSEQTVGLFAFQNANISFGAGALFTFNPNDTYFAQSWQFGNGNLFQVGIVDSPTLSGIDDQLGYSQSANLNDFDPNIISVFGFNFDATASGFAFDSAGSMGDGATFINGSSTLHLRALSTTNASFNAVPEPSGLGLLGASAWGLLSLRRRRGPWISIC